MCPCGLGDFKFKWRFPDEISEWSVYYGSLPNTLSKIVMTFRFVGVWVANVLFECLKKKF